MTEALPPFPRPTARSIAGWWHEYRKYKHVELFPHFPSPTEIKAWFRERRHLRFLPPLPKLPGPKTIAKRIKDRPPKEWRYSVLPGLPSAADFGDLFASKRRRRKFLVWSLITTAVIVGLIYAGPPASRQIKAWQAKRLATQARDLAEQQNWAEATRKLRAAFQLGPTEPEVWRAYACFLSRTGQGALGVEWWQKVAQIRTLSTDDHRDFAAAALAANELSIASEQVGLLVNQPQGPTPHDMVLAGQLSTLRGYTSTAVNFAEQVLAWDHSTSREKLGANLIILSNKTPETPEYKDAFARVVDIARDPTDRSAPQALAVLGQHRSAARLTETINGVLDIRVPDLGDTAMSLQEIADRLEANPNSQPFQRMLALDLRARAEPLHEDELVTRGMQLYANADDETVIALGSWLYSRGRFKAMLTILPLERAIQRRELLIERIDALAALQQLQEVKKLLVNEYAVLEPSFQHMYLAVVRARLGETAAVQNEWQRALALAVSPNTLIGLAEYAEQKGALDIAEAAYDRLIERQPDLKSAYLLRFQLAQARGRTAQARDMAAEIIRLWPEDDATRMREIYLRLLVDTSHDAADAAEQEAYPFLAHNPWNGAARTAVALAELRKGESAAALTTLTEFTPGIPSAAISGSVYAAALAANGWTEKAREQAIKLATENILPEERAMIAPLMRE